MILADVVAIFLVFGIIFITTISIHSLWENHDGRKNIAFEAATKTLSSNDYKEYENVLALHGKYLNRDIRKLLSSRKDELYVDKMLMP